MRVLFVSKGKNSEPSTIVKKQGESIKKHVEYLNYFVINSYSLSTILQLKNKIKKDNISVVHAHFSYSAFLTLLALIPLRNIKLVVSFMGSDVISRDKNFIKGLINKIIIKLLIQKSDHIIVKSEELKTKIGFKEAEIIPNGVNFDNFKPWDKSACKQKLNLDISKKYILFAANPDRKEKNFDLFNQAFVNLKKQYTNLESLYLKGIDPNDVPQYMNASEVVCLSSFYEGSPNVIKEALICNKKIVTTQVGDVKELFVEMDGCYTTNFDLSDYQSKLHEALLSNINIDNRSRCNFINEDYIAKKILQIYTI